MTQDHVRQSPIGFYLLGCAYIDAADKLVSEISDQAQAFRLAFDSPVRHLYAHGWELCLKACLFEQGIPPSVLKSRKFGHSLIALWRVVDRDRFAVLNLHARLEHVLHRLDRFHPTKLYAYPLTGYRNDFSLTYIREISQRFRLSRPMISRHFSAHAPRLL